MINISPYYKYHQIKCYISLFNQPGGIQLGKKQQGNSKFKISILSLGTILSMLQ